MKIPTAVLLSLITPSSAFVPSVHPISAICTRHHQQQRQYIPSLFMSQEEDDAQQQQQQEAAQEIDDDQEPINYTPPQTDAAGAELASQFSAILSKFNITKMDDLEEEDVTGLLGEEEDDNEERIPKGRSTLRDMDLSSDEYEAEFMGVEETTSDEEMARDWNEAVVNMDIEIDYDLDDLDEEEGEEEYVVPLNVPDAGLSAGEVATLVITALRNNDNPTPNKGIEIFFGYASPNSQVSKEIEKGMTPQQYKDFLLFSKDYAALFNNDDLFIEKGDVNYDSMKAYYTIRVLFHDRRAPDLSVNFILSTQGGESDPWLIDSMLIRPSLRRNLGRRR